MGNGESLTNRAVDLAIDTNGTEHNTSRYDVMVRNDTGTRLVVRRGQEFYLIYQRDDTYVPSDFTIYIKFTLDGHDVANSRHGTVFTDRFYGTKGSWNFLAEAGDQEVVSIKVSLGKL